MVRTAGVFCFLVLAGCSSKPRIIVGSKNFTEQVVLAEIIAQQIEKNTSIEVERKFYLGGTLLAQEALKSGSIDLYPEYSGTALTAILKRPINKDPKAVLAEVRQGYAQWHLSWLQPFGFNNTFAMVVRTADAQQQHLHTLTDAAHRPQPWRLGVGYEFVERPDGLNGLKKAYDLRIDREPVTMDLGLLYPALRNGNIQMGAGSATDASLTDAAFTVLDDDKHYFPPYECDIVVRDETLAKFPKLKTVLEELAGRISDNTMRQLNAAVDREHRPVAKVAAEFLARGGKP
jgi:glycine betaine/choline ABC-type transport system substrate-binding protein